MNPASDNEWTNQTDLYWLTFLAVDLPAIIARLTWRRLTKRNHNVLQFRLQHSHHKPPLLGLPYYGAGTTV